jgi:hypothetical protein
MKFFIQLSCATLLLCRSLAAGNYIDLGPMLGHVGPDKASIWFKASGPGTNSAVARSTFFDGIA